jgi:hypothetical protein
MDFPHHLRFDCGYRANVDLATQRPENSPAQILIVTTFHNRHQEMGRFALVATARDCYAHRTIHRKVLWHSRFVTEISIGLWKQKVAAGLQTKLVSATLMTV